jgi:hypothetical protein
MLFEEKLLYVTKELCTMMLLIFLSSSLSRRLHECFISRASLFDCDKWHIQFGRSIFIYFIHFFPALPRVCVREGSALKNVN